MKHSSPLSNKNLFQEAVDNSASIRELLVYLGLRAAGGNYKQARYWSQVHGIPLPVYIPELGRNITSYYKIPSSDVFKENSLYTNRTQIKKRLLNLGWSYECSIPECPITNTWLDKPVSLHLDHINGVHNDNRFENLRFICPMCHSQTSTFSGRNSKKPVQISLKERPTKINWPEQSILLEMVKSSNYLAVGRELGVSDNAVRKRIKKLSE